MLSEKCSVHLSLNDGSVIVAQPDLGGAFFLGEGEGRLGEGEGEGRLGNGRTEERLMCLQQHRSVQRCLTIPGTKRTVE